MLTDLDLSMVFLRCGIACLIGFTIGFTIGLSAGSRRQPPSVR